MALKNICLDTSAYSHFQKGDPAAVEIIRGAREIHVPVVVLGELRIGFRSGSRAEENEKDLGRFLSNIAVAIVPVDDEASSLYADLMVDLRRAGDPVPTNDVWIAACAIQTGATLIAYDEHFVKIRRLGCKILS